MQSGFQQLLRTALASTQGQLWGILALVDLFGILRTRVLPSVSSPADVVIIMDTNMFVKRSI